MANEHRLTFTEAAHALGISTEAVRMRVRRGKLPSERDEDGNVKVLVDADQVVPDETNDLVSVLREQLAEEREARRRADHIILNLTQANATLASRVPALQAAADERRDANASREEPAGGYPSTGSRKDSEKPSSWWSRLFR